MTNRVSATLFTRILRAGIAVFALSEAWRTGDSLLLGINKYGLRYLPDYSTTTAVFPPGLTAILVIFFTPYSPRLPASFQSVSLPGE